MNFSSVEDLIARKNQLIAEINKEGESIILDLFQQFFDQYPDVVCVRLQGYRLYFNDRDAGEFTISDPAIHTTRDPVRLEDLLGDESNSWFESSYAIEAFDQIKNDPEGPGNLYHYTTRNNGQTCSYVDNNWNEVGDEFLSPLQRKQLPEIVRRCNAEEQLYEQVNELKELFNLVYGDNFQIEVCRSESGQLKIERSDYTDHS